CRSCGLPVRSLLRRARLGTTSKSSPTICVRHASYHCGLGIIAAAGGGPLRTAGLFTAVAITLLTAFPAAPARAPVLHSPTPGTPRLADGTPNLSAPAPRTADGKPDLSGVWRGAGPFYRFNIAEDLELEDVQPWAHALFLQRVRDSRKDSPLTRCLPV